MSSDIPRLISDAVQALQRGDYLKLKTCASKALKSNPHNVQGKELLAYALANSGNKDEALQLLLEITELHYCPLSVLYECSSLLLEKQDFVKAISLLERAYIVAPESFEVLHDLATAYAHVGKKQAALDKFLSAALIRQDSPELLYNIGRMYDDLRSETLAIEFYEKAIQLNKQFSNAWINRGLDLNLLGRPLEAITSLKEGLRLNPNAGFIFGDIAHIHMQIGDWKSFEANLSTLEDGVKEHREVIHPFHLLSLVDRPELQKEAAEIYTQRNHNEKFDYLGLNSGGDSKIKVAYFSADFRNHAVANLTAELFELHDKNGFEIYAFSLGFQNHDEMTKRLKKSFHEFIDVSTLTDQEVVDLARSKGIDIAVDLGGYTEHSRSGIFQRRAAPIQASYLGYLGTLGSTYIDYIFADHEVIPPNQQKYFSEKIAYLPNCFQVNDRQRMSSDRQFTKADLGLPEKGFVFCCFNNTYKITPKVFLSWCRILKKVEGSVLWLYESNLQISGNLRRAVTAQGIDPNRLVFGGALPAAEYLARYKLADLFLDTSPYNAGTTASDALWSGLPVITRMGESFQSRMAGSILKAIDMPDLIAQTVSEYEDLAVRLATYPEDLQAIRKRVTANKLITPLFDSPQTTKHIERAYQVMHANHLAGKEPENIDVGELY
ncbi:Predicted O-linked N-acetylglucosamine transferase, SPINDLY family [Polynucleobacter meluiroseus]|uniref:protein O-GlcNAc transferase n=1 Tax=Polynucleobacter meluiroseus TaxID=1938814 RepID=A0A240E0F3_9BURK|nr:glycosyltransferase family 41 protein [Polynucleobacter meluiroseus]SNX28919.1 Predicted O-linked N-acetylglucosamine transferase, SPINDLY family [Polynucleobacter meluiroseus]